MIIRITQNFTKRPLSAKGAKMNTFLNPGSSLVLLISKPRDIRSSPELRTSL